MEVRLKDWFNHQLQRGMNKPVAGGDDPELSEFSDRFGNQPLAHGHGLEDPLFELGTQDGLPPGTDRSIPMFGRPLAVAVARGCAPIDSKKRVEQARAAPGRFLLES